MDEASSSEDRACEAAAEHTSIGRILALGSIALWLIVLLMLAGGAGVRGF
jgi:hypothetical protein